MNLLGTVRIDSIFNIKSVPIYGCTVLTGVVRKDAGLVPKDKLDVLTPIRTIKRYKDDVEEVTEGMQCGIVADLLANKGDILEVYELEKKNELV